MLEKKTLLGLVGAVALAGLAYYAWPSGGSDLPLEEDPALMEGEGDLELPPGEGNSGGRRVVVQDGNEQRLSEIALYADTPNGIVRLTGNNGWARVPVSEDRATPVAALAERRWSAVTEVTDGAEEDPILVAETAAGHLRLDVSIEGLETAPAPWVEIHALGEDGLSAAAELYLDVLSAGSFLFHGTEGELGIQDLPPVAYRLDVGHAGCPDVRLTLRLEEGQVLQHSVRLEQGASLSATVVEPTATGEEEARAIAGAEVALWPVQSRASGWDDPLVPFRIYGNLPPRIGDQDRARSDGSGAVRFTDIPPGRYQLLVSAPGYRPMVGEQIIQLGSGADETYRPLVLEMGAVQEVQVVSEDGLPIADAEVRWQLRPPSGRPLPGQSASSRQLTDAAGHSRLVGLPQTQLWLQVMHPDFAATEVSFEPTIIEPKPLDLTLFRGRSLEGQVIDLDTGEGLEGVGLKLLPQRGGDAAQSGFETGFTTEVTTDAQGGFAFHGLPPDPYLVLAHHEGYAPFLSAPINITTDTLGSVVLPLEVGAALTVELLDENGGPVAQEWVVALCEDPESFSRQRTDDRGIARFEHLAAGTYRVMKADSVAAAVSAGGRLHRDYEYASLLNRDEHHILLGGRQVYTTLEGFLLLEGKPAVGRRVVLLADDGTRICTSDASGFYQFENLLPGRYLFQVSSKDGPGAGSFYGSALVTHEEVVQRDILLPAATLDLQVLDQASGQAIAYMPITLRPADGTDLVGGQMQATDAQGKVRFHTLRDGDYLICAGDAASPFYGGDGQYGAILKRISIRADLDPHPSLKLQAPRGSTVLARIKDQQGRPLQDVHLHYQDVYGNTLNRVSMQGSNARGDQQMRGLPSGPGFLVARHPEIGLQRIAIDLVPGQRTHREMRLEPGVLLKVQVVDPEGRPLPGVMVHALDNEGQPLFDLSTTQELQKARLAYLRGTSMDVGPLPPGHYDLRLQRPGEAPEIQRVTVKAGVGEQHLRLTYGS
ncbi:MAG: carboxypeptidase regulatory-like domain-containing protein [Planctomycetota bacterium]